LARISRHTVERCRPNLTAISASDSRRSIPTRISSRSASDRTPSRRTRSRLIGTGSPNNTNCNDDRAIPANRAASANDTPRDTATNAGYNAGTFTLTCYAHKHSNADEAADASYMSTTRKVRIVEIDPVDPAAPLSWDRVVASQTGNTITLTAALSSPSWDATKHYRVIWDDYPDAIAAQQTHAYQADDADGRIADTRAPYQYSHQAHKQNGAFPPTSDYAHNSAGDPIELPPSSSFGDGVGVDVGTDVAINRLATNLIDYKTAHIGPTLATLTTVLGDVTHDYILSAIIPINLSPDGLSQTVKRYLYVSPFGLSSTSDGIIRITLSRNMPSEDTPHNVDRGSLYGEAVFTAIGGTFTTPTAKAISIGSIKDNSGTAYLLIELKAGAGSSTISCYGLGICYEGPRA
jgi:hypothetical protein